MLEYCGFPQQSPRVSRLTSLHLRPRKVEVYDLDGDWCPHSGTIVVLVCMTVSHILLLHPSYLAMTLNDWPRNGGFQLIPAWPAICGTPFWGLGVFHSHRRSEDLKENHLGQRAKRQKAAEQRKSGLKATKTPRYVRDCHRDAKCQEMGFDLWVVGRSRGHSDTFDQFPVPMSWSTLNHSLHRLNKDQILNVPFTNLTDLVTSTSPSNGQQTLIIVIFIFITSKFFRFSWAFPHVFPTFVPRFFARLSAAEGTSEVSACTASCCCRSCVVTQRLRPISPSTWERPGGDFWHWHLGFYGNIYGNKYGKHLGNLPKFSISPNYMMFFFFPGNIWGNISENYMGNMFDDIFGKTYSKGSYEKVPGVPKVIFDIWEYMMIFLGNIFEITFWRCSKVFYDINLGDFLW